MRFLPMPNHIIYSAELFSIAICATNETVQLTRMANSQADRCIRLFARRRQIVFRYARCHWVGRFGFQRIAAAYRWFRIHFDHAVDLSLCRWVVFGLWRMRKRWRWSHLYIAFRYKTQIDSMHHTQMAKLTCYKVRMAIFPSGHFVLCTLFLHFAGLEIDDILIQRHWIVAKSLFFANSLFDCPLSATIEMEKVHGKLTIIGCIGSTLSIRIGFWGRALVW